MEKLTDRQHEILDTIKKEIAKNKVQVVRRERCPSDQVYISTKLKNETIIFRLLITVSNQSPRNWF